MPETSSDTGPAEDVTAGDITNLNDSNESSDATALTDTTNHSTDTRSQENDVVVEKMKPEPQAMTRNLGFHGGRRRKIRNQYSIRYVCSLTDAAQSSDGRHISYAQRMLGLFSKRNGQRGAFESL